MNYRQAKVPRRPDPRPSTRMRRLAERSARVRSRRAEVRRQIERGERDILELLAEPPTVLRTTRILDALQWSPWVGRKRAEQILRRARVSLTAEFGWAPQSARERIIAELGKRRAHAARQRERVAA